MPVKPAPAELKPAPESKLAAQDDDDEKIEWGWPTSGRLLAGYSENANKGLDIVGKSGQPVLAKPYMDKINWTKGIDQKTGKPVDYDPSRDLQVYSGVQNQTMAERTKKLCPAMSGGNNFTARI